MRGNKLTPQGARTYGRGEHEWDVITGVDLPRRPPKDVRRRLVRKWRHRVNQWVRRMRGGEP